MPRKPIEIPETIEYLSILDENAKLDEPLAPKLSADDLRTIYRYMLMARRTDERMLTMQRQGRMGTFPQSAGHEAVSMGAAFAITASDWQVPAYRELAGMLYRGWGIEHFMLYWNGYEEGARMPDHVFDLPICVPIATQLLHAVGIGMAINIKKEKKVVLTFFGDGASSEGDCHEALNFAAVFQAPVVFVCVNNQYAISVPLSRQMRSETVAQRAIAYGMPGIKVDGNDVLAVYAATKEAVERARSGGGPTLIEALTYRLTPHTTADDPKRYRTEEEYKLWNNREPLKRMRKFLEGKNLLNTEQEAALEAEIDASIKQAMQRAEAIAKSEEASNPLTMFDHLYSDIPKVLQAQREELSKRLKPKKQVSERHNPQKSESQARK
jgi:pyruvate dehydrogenase E1 component alpha subunit